MFEYTTTCPLVEHGELVTGWVALVAVAMGKKIDATMNASNAKMLRFFIVAPITSCLFTDLSLRNFDVYHLRK